MNITGTTIDTNSEIMFKLILLLIIDVIMQNHICNYTFGW